MASNTENLNLLMKNPSTDGADTFNVQTMLNENWQKIDANAGTVAQTLANILKPTTPPIIGLSPSTTPDGMFQALGNTGELHVWRKTVVSSSEQPAGYTLGDVIENSEIWVENSNETVFHYATSISVSDTGLVSLVDEKTANIGHAYSGQNITEFDVFKGKFVYISGGDNNKRQFIFYIPANATFYRNGTYGTNKIYADKEQRVNAHGIIPAGTTTTYPVSTNPKAYQEGDDAKAAGYTLGEVIKSTGAYGFFGMMGFAYGTSYFQKISDAIEVADDGSVSHVAPVDNISDSTVLDSASVLKERIAGKYITLSENSYTKQPYTNELPPTNAVLYIPADVNVKMIHPEGSSLSNQYALFFDRYQPVTGYAAIPAGTTIEYLGKLGDKARVQVLSYVGTGTFGKSNACSLTFDFAPNRIFWLGITDSSFVSHVNPAKLSTNYSQTNAIGSTKSGQRYTKISEDKKTIMWYQTASPYYQLNDKGVDYAVVAIG